MALAVFHDQIEALRQQYIFADSSSIEGFLDVHPVLIPLLHAARRKITEYFGEVPVRLRMGDGEDGSRGEYLVAAVQSTATADEALNTLDRFDADWWLGVAGHAADRLLITVEYAW